MHTKIKFIFAFLIISISQTDVIGQCANNSNIYSFIYNGKTYEVIKENKNWVSASACAVARGGWLAEIDDLAEQNAIYAALNSSANINANSTVAPDGGGGAYVWIGGNDLAVEGNWVWDGNNDNTSTQFWMGKANGSPIGGLYNNWGNEPDDFNGQDALGLSLNGWPLGVASEWNDVDHTNTLYYVIEYAGISGFQDLNFNNNIKVFPNPITNTVNIENQQNSISTIELINSNGKKIKDYNAVNSTTIKLDLSDISKGIYFFKIGSKNGKTIFKQIIKSE